MNMLTFRSLIPALCLTALMTLSYSCKKDEPGQGGGDVPGTDISIKASLVSPLPGTRASLSDMMALKWKKRDAICVIGETTETFTITDTKYSETGNFAGKAVAGSSFTLIHPAIYKTPAALESKSFENQIQFGNGSTSHIEYFAMLSAVSSYKDVSFSSEWAQAHGGRFCQAGVWQLRLAAPTGMTTLSSLRIEAPGEVFCTTNAATPKSRSLSINVDGVDVSGDDDKTFVVNLAISIQGISLSASDQLTLTMTDSDDIVWSRTLTPGSLTIPGGCVTTLAVDASGWSKTTEIKGSGTQSDPYQLVTRTDLRKIKTLVKTSGKTWFKLMDNIDMTGSEGWTPCCASAQAIDFDGNGKTITGFSCGDVDNASFFGLLNGSVRNLTFSSPSVTTFASTPTGVVAAWLGKSDGSYTGTLENVLVDGGSVLCSAATLQPAGGLVGEAGKNSAITGCRFDGVVTNSAAIESSDTRTPTGGIIGRISATDVTVTNCSTSGTISTTNGRYVGGILGYATVNVNINNFSDNSSSATVSSALGHAGGIIGRFENGGLQNCTFTGKVTCMSGGYLGGIIGYSEGKSSSSSVKNCYIKNCTFAGTVESGYNYAGGIVSQTSGCKLTIDACHSNGSVTGAERIGGYVGYVMAPESGAEANCAFVIKGCSSDGLRVVASGKYAGGVMAISAQSGLAIQVSDSNIDAEISAECYAGGIIGQAQSGATIKNTQFTGSLQATASDVSQLGGIVGYCNAGKLSVSDCAVNANLTAGGGTATGGIVAQLGANTNATPAVIARCSYNGTLAGGQYSGGIVGYFQKCKGTIENCYASGAISGKTSTGGLVGDLYEGCTLTTSFCNASVLGNYGVGGLVGRAANAAWVATIKPGITVSKCIAWNPSIKTTKAGGHDANSDTSGSGGAIIGFTSIYNVLTDCYRKSSIDFQYYSAGEQNTLYDQANASESSALVVNYPGSRNYPYHGKASSASTISTVATNLSWSSTVWDLTASVPTLK